MIDLSNAKIDDKFNYVSNIGDSVNFGKENSKQIMKVVFAGSDDRVMQTENGSLHVFNHKCKSSECGTWKITTRHEPRWWLKKLPDADLFRGNWLACSDSCNNSEWHAWDEEPSEGLTSWVKKPCGNIFCERVTAIKMPKLIGDEWKQSKISIPDLREWQKANG